MKKSVFGIAALLLALAACNKIETESQPADKTGGIPFSATVSLGNTTTKALAESDGTLTATWEAGEKVALIHNGVSDEMEVTSVSGGSATISGTITGTPADGDAVTIIYPSSAADGTTGDVKSDLLAAQEGTLADIAANYDVRKGSGTLKVDGTATLDGSVSLTNQFAIFKFTVKNYDGSAAISAMPLTITIDEQDYVITPATATDVLYVALPAVSGEKVSFDATDGSSKTYTCAKSSVTFAAGSYYQSTLKMREYVDLGTVVDGKKIKWATMNVGATKPEKYGDYFAWGETATKEDYTWATYKWMQSGQSDWKHITKYTFADEQKEGIWYDGDTFVGDGKTSLADYSYADDAARANWGGTWRIPMDAEWTALRDEANFDWSWTDDYEGTGIAGRIVTSKVPGYEGNSIFLPAAGYRDGTSLHNGGSYGCYWSSSLFEGRSGGARDVFFYSSSVLRDYDLRCYGFSVRPVSE